MYNMVRNELSDGEVSARDKLLHLISVNSTDSKFFGRTKLTKLGFFAEYWDPEQDVLEPRQQLGDFQYVIYKYGPFSKELFDKFDNLKTSDLLEESRQPIGGAEISVTERGQKRAKQIREQLNESDIGQIHAVSETFGDRNGGELEELSLEYLNIDKHDKEKHQSEKVENLIDRDK